MALALQPKILKNFVLFVDGDAKAGRCEEVNLPSLELTTEEHRAGGMDAPLKHDMGMNAIEISFSMIEYDPKVLKLFGLRNQASARLTFRGHADDNAGNSQSIVVVASGQIQGMNSDPVQAGRKAGLRFMMNCLYYHLYVGGERIIEINIPGMVRRIGLEDQLEAVRANLGL